LKNETYWPGKQASFQQIAKTGTRHANPKLFPNDFFLVNARCKPRLILVDSNPGVSQIYTELHYHMAKRKSRGSATPFASEWIVVMGRIKDTKGGDFNNKISENGGLNPKALRPDEMIFLQVSVYVSRRIGRAKRQSRF
jgi:hypothetical protein